MTATASLPTCGAQVLGQHTRFTAYTSHPRCAVRVDRPGGGSETHPMDPLGGGYFEAHVRDAGHGTLYKFVLDSGEWPDPYARFLPEGVHGRAMVVEARHCWRAGGVVRPLREHVIYELHVGTFTREGTYSAARERLAELAELGITALELMPLAAADGARGWGYDGVALYAPFAPYGSPDDLRDFVDCAHELGLSVFLDVVYNHFGPAGNYLALYHPNYFTTEFQTAWGDAPNFAFPALRKLVLDNAHYWLSEFRFDGLRLDAVHAIVDPSPQHVLEQLSSQVRALQPRKILIGEDDRNDPDSITASGLDAVWADDFHHQLRVTLTAERDGYYAAYEPSVAGVAQAINRGWLYEGQTYPGSGKPRGKSATSLASEHFVYCIQNHDQVGNRATGERLSAHVSMDAFCAASMLLLFLPMTPLLFMGQEWAATSPFLYFTDHAADLGRAISAGRREEFKTFAEFSRPEALARIPDPQALSTFVASKLNWDERQLPEHSRVVALYRECLRLRRTDCVLQNASREQLRAHAQDDVLVVRRGSGEEERFLLVNFGKTAVDVTTAMAGLRSARVLLASTSQAGLHCLPASAALLLARGNSSQAR